MLSHVLRPVYLAYMYLTWLLLAEQPSTGHTLCVNRRHSADSLTVVQVCHELPCLHCSVPAGAGMLHQLLSLNIVKRRICTVENQELMTILCWLKLCHLADSTLQSVPLAQSILQSF